MERRSKPRRRRGRGLLFLLVFAALTGLYVRWGNTALQMASFSAVLRDLPPGFDGCRAVVLGDLHSTWFGGKNEKPLGAVEAQEPEYIFLVGNSVRSVDTSPSVKGRRITPPWPWPETTRSAPRRLYCSGKWSFRWASSIQKAFSP